jgi:uncharacterized protein (DUF2235 family)
VGALWPRHLPFTSSNRIVRTFRHALALDEHRAKFKANVWHYTAATSKDAFYDPEAGSPVQDKSHLSVFQRAWQTAGESISKVATEVTEVGSGQMKAVSTQKPSMHDEVPSEEDEYPGRSETDVKEVWFAGCHAGVFQPKPYLNRI